MDDEMKFERREEFEKLVREQFEGAGLSREFLNQLTQLVAREFETTDEAQANPIKGRKLILRNRRWVIRNDDLSLIKAVSDGFKSAAAAGFFLPADLATVTVVSALAGIAMSVIQVVRQVVKKGASLSTEAVTVLSTLKLHKSGASAYELTIALNLANDKNGKRWTEAEVQKELNKLEKVALRDGSVEALVKQDAKGLWLASGV
jgi:hypothetical protein